MPWPRSRSTNDAIPDREIYSLDITLLTLDKAAAEECSSCSDANGSDNNCKSIWNEDFVCPDKLVELVKETTLQKISMARQITPDNNPNGVENA